MREYHLESFENTDNRVFNIIGRPGTRIDASRFELDEAAIFLMRSFAFRQMIDIRHFVCLEMSIYNFVERNTKYIFWSICLVYLRLHKFDGFSVIPKYKVTPDTKKYTDLLTESLKTYRHPHLSRQCILAHGELWPVWSTSLRFWYVPVSFIDLRL